MRFIAPQWVLTRALQPGCIRFNFYHRSQSVFNLIYTFATKQPCISYLIIGQEFAVRRCITTGRMKPVLITWNRFDLFNEIKYTMMILQFI